MIYRRLGETSLNVSVLGYGCWGVGGGSDSFPAYGKMNSEKISKAIEKAIDKGINFFDTSSLYGGGKSEIFLSKILPKYRKKIYISTKAGLLDIDKKCFSSSFIKKSLEDSLKRLKTDYIDLFQLHNFDKDDFYSFPDIENLLLDLKKEGKILEWGISSKTPQNALDLLKIWKSPTVQCNFNILDKRCIDNNLLSYCDSNKIGVIARTPLAFGFLSLKIKAEENFSSSDHRSRWSIDTKKGWIENSQKIANILCIDKSMTMAQWCIKFCITPSVISTCIPGMHSIEEVEENYNAIISGPLKESHFNQVCDYDELMNL